ncbi:hypothetical protein G3570_08655 [Balneolaceae bacterium YR4-1]|uniref:Uncharacterized protein n=1 Tax=Halalkalibaculum roseum TaxID=2709311 RepID=A0A6M1SMX7_9BACT|nr:hypothetical protein [Halalkalibaculum roseum]NGP76701.1 hypothetical protein [Halalkalibaculum roseum]
MKKNGVLAFASLFVGLLFAFISCDQSTSDEFQESFQKVKQVTPIPGAQNERINLQPGDSQDSFFTVTLDDGTVKEGWCIEWNESYVQGEQNGVKMFSTKGQEAWKELNYFMHIKDKLRAQDPDLTFREIQVVIWSLVDNPEFDVDNISEYSHINPRIYNNGEVLFDIQKVKDIVNQVEAHFVNSASKLEAEYSGTTIIENDGQTIMMAGETAFAYNPNYSTCFDEEIIANTTFPNWGWTNGPISDGFEDTFDIWAGAGQCDLSKGTLVGELFVSYSGGTLTATYNMTVTSPYTNKLYTMTTAHLYAGGDAYPTNGGEYTVAPGQYTEVHDPLSNLTTYTIEISGLSGAIYFIAHADVEGFDPDA